MPNIGALTTTFTPNPSCSTYAGYTESVDDDNDYYYLQGPIATNGCFPEGYNPDHQYFFSPAAACPAGYTQACQSVTSLGTATETVRTCCPSAGTYSCQGALDPDHFTWQSTLGCASNIFGTVTLAPVTHVDHANTTVVSSTILYRGGVGAQAVILRYQSSDLSKFTASPSSSATSGQPPATSTAASSTASSQPTQTNAPSSGLSAGAAAGIGAGCGIAGAALIGVGAFLLWKRRHDARDSGSRPSSTYPPQKYHPIELTDGSHPTSSSPASAYTGYDHSNSATNSSAVGTQHTAFASPPPASPYNGEHLRVSASNRALSPQELSTEAPHELPGR